MPQPTPPTARDAALTTARDKAGLSSGPIVVLTAGRRTGRPGATNLIMVQRGSATASVS
jgi:hypothetical protein